MHPDIMHTVIYTYAHVNTKYNIHIGIKHTQKTAFVFSLCFLNLDTVQWAQQKICYQNTVVEPLILSACLTAGRE